MPRRFVERQSNPNILLRMRLDEFASAAQCAACFSASANFVCANLTADVITRILPDLVGATCGKLILSGILETQVEMVQAGLHDCGVDDFEVVQDGEWVALIV